MLLKLLGWLFERVIGALPEPKKAALREQFRELLFAVVQAAAEGAIKGVTKP